MIQSQFQTQNPVVYNNPQISLQQRLQFHHYRTPRPQIRSITPSYRPQNTQSSQSYTEKTENVIFYGTYALQKFSEPHRKFRPLTGIKLTEKQQCLLDNFWHVQTVSQAASHKVQILNALCIYFKEQSLKIPEQRQRKYTHYVIFKGTKLGIFNKWETVAKHIQCIQPIFKGYYSFTEALKAAREAFGLNDYFIEPEETKSFSDITQTSPEQIIKAQEEMIAHLQKQLLEQGKNTETIVVQLENRILREKEKIMIEKIDTLQRKLDEKEKQTNTMIYRDFDSFKARVLDIPWQHTLHPLFEDFPEIKQVIEDKIRREFPLVLYELQLKIIRLAFEGQTGVTIV